MIVTFFGHSDTPSSVRPLLLRLLKEIAEKEPTAIFYVGNSGRFDALALSALREMQGEYPSICYFVVLSHIPRKKENGPQMYETIFPERAARVLPRFAINERNKWMLEHSDAVITYITNLQTNAAKWGKMAQRMGKHVIPLGL